MKVIIGRKKREVTNKDYILYNGTCYQVITLPYNNLLAKSTFNRLLREGKIVRSHRHYVGIGGVKYPLYRFVCDGKGEE